MGKKEKRKENVNLTYQEIISKIKSGMANHGKEFLVGIHEKLSEIDELYEEAPSKEEHQTDMEIEQVTDEDSETDEEELSSSSESESEDSDKDSSDQDQEFCTVQSKKRKHSDSPPPTLDPSTSADVMEIPTPPSNPPPEPQASSRPTTTTPAAAVQNETPDIQRKSAIMPPIICYKLNVAELSRYTRGLRITYKIHNINSVKSVITTRTKDDHSKVKEFLLSRKTEFNTYTSKEDKKTLLVLKGIHHSYEVAEIKSELILEGIPVMDVSPYKTTRTDRKFNNFVVQVEKNCEIASVYRKTLLMNQKVHWEKLKTNGITQCKNCQKFGHVASNCGMKYRCVKCKEEHLPGNCQRNTNNKNDDEVFCANCQTNGHPANYKGCPKYKQKVAERVKIAQKKKEQHQFAVKSATQAIKSGLSFADVAAMSSTTQKSPQLMKSIVQPATKPSNTQASKSKPILKPVSAATLKSTTAPSAQFNLFDDTERLFGTDLFTILQKAKKVIPNNYGALDDRSKTMILGRLIFEICSPQ